MIMPPNVNVSRVVRLSAQISGTVKESVPMPVKLAFKGDMFASINPVPAVSPLPTLKIHQGTNRETTISAIVPAPPAMPNQLILRCMTFLHSIIPLEHSEGQRFRSIVQ